MLYPLGLCAGQVDVADTSVPSLHLREVEKVGHRQLLRTGLFAAPVYCEGVSTQIIVIPQTPLQTAYSCYSHNQFFLKITSMEDMGWLGITQMF